MGSFLSMSLLSKSVFFMTARKFWITGRMEEPWHQDLAEITFRNPSGMEEHVESRGMRGKINFDVILQICPGSPPALGQLSGGKGIVSDVLLGHLFMDFHPVPGIFVFKEG